MLFRAIVLLFVFVLTGQQLMGQGAETARPVKHFNLKNGVALQGYDPVAYFTMKKAVEGNSSLACSYQGVTYYFSKKENLELFKQNPQKYEPQYGGWCAFALGDKGEKVKIDPETFKLTDGKLYLFYNFFFNNTLEKWNKDEAALKKKADVSWENLIKK